MQILKLVKAFFLLPLSLFYWNIQFAYTQTSRVIHFVSTSIFQNASTLLPLILIGGLRMGGSGKTPVTIALAQYFKQNNMRVAIMAYWIHQKPMFVSWRKLQTKQTHKNTCLYSDEATLIQQKTQVDVYITRNRYNLWKYLSQTNQYDLILSDDGLQDPKLANAYQILLKHPQEDPKIWDIFPSGPFRFLTGKQKQVSQVLHGPYFLEKSLKNTVLSDTPSPPTFYRKLQLPSPTISDNWTLVCALGNPQRLLQHLLKEGFSIQTTFFYPDHSLLPEQELLEQLKSNQLGYFLITEKDAVKLPLLSGSPKCFIIQESILFSPSPDIFLPPFAFS